MGVGLGLRQKAEDPKGERLGEGIQAGLLEFLHQRRVMVVVVVVLALVVLVCVALVLVLVLVALVFVALVLVFGVLVRLVVPVPVGHDVVIALVPVPGKHHPDMAEPSPSLLDRAYLDLHVRGAEKGRHGSDRFRIHEARIQEGRSEHVPCDAGEAVEIKGSHGHPWVGAAATDSTTGDAAASSENPP